MDSVASCSVSEDFGVLREIRIDHLVVGSKLFFDLSDRVRFGKSRRRDNFTYFVFVTSVGAWGGLRFGRGIKMTIAN